MPKAVTLWSHLVNSVRPEYFRCYDEVFDARPTVQVLRVREDCRIFVVDVSFVRQFLSHRDKTTPKQDQQAQRSRSPARTGHGTKTGHIGASHLSLLLLTIILNSLHGSLLITWLRVAHLHLILRFPLVY